MSRSGGWGWGDSPRAVGASHVPDVSPSMLRATAVPSLLCLIKSTKDLSCQAQNSEGKATLTILDHEVSDHV